MNFRKIVGKSMVVIALSTYFASSAYAEESTESLQEDAQKQLSILQEQQEKKQTLEEQMGTAESKLQEIQSSMGSLQEEIGQVEEEVLQVTEQINANKEEIVTLEESMYARQDLVKERLVAMQQTSKDNVLIDILLNSESIVDLVQKAYSVFVIFGADKDILDTQQADLEQLEKIKVEIEENEQTLENRQQQLTNKQDELENLEAEQQNKLQEIQSSYEEVSNEIKLTKAEQEDIEAKLVALETAAKEEAELLVTATVVEETESVTNIEAEEVDIETTEKIDEVEATSTEETESVTIEKTEEANVTDNTANSNQSESTESNQDSEVSAQEEKTIYVTATAYTPDDSTTGKTVTGFDIWANPNARIIAVDPNVIPLGTKVWIEGYGEAIAADTGGAITGYKIDVLLPTTADALNWGRRTVKVIVQS